MMRPEWSPVDDDTADLLALVANDPHPSVDLEWEEWRRAVIHCAMQDGGLVDPNRLRRLVRGIVAPKRLGAFTSRAKAEGLLVKTDKFEISDDREGRNSGKPARVYAVPADYVREAS